MSCYYPTTCDWWAVDSHSISFKDIPIIRKDTHTSGLINLPLGSFVTFPLRLEGNDAKEIRIACFGPVLKDGRIKLKYGFATSYKVLSLKIPLFVNYLDHKGYKLTE